MVHPQWHELHHFPELTHLLEGKTIENSDVEFLRSPIRVCALRGGLTNRLYCVEIARGSPQQLEKWVVRVSGENYEVHFINRAEESICLRAAHVAGITPVSHYLPSETLLCSLFIEDNHTFTNHDAQNNIDACMELLHKLHAIDKASYSSQVFDVFAVSKHYLDFSRSKDAPLPQDIEQTTALMNRIHAVVSNDKYSRSLSTVCCHNDVLAANWITGSVQGKHQLWVIDFEYAGIGDRFFDLANFSANCELNEQQDKMMLKIYFALSDDDAEELEQLYARLSLFKMASDFRESLWSFVQWCVSKTCEPAFFAQYGETCMERFRVSAKDPRFEGWLNALTESNV
eukprot:c5972_g1_i1.p1 GENE.c5972_g1_i1~~c5972_g1_i1.p1  ORF type:complete len:343 (+),score=81.14 c5972_g1_i1:32-1060(+)